MPPTWPPDENTPPADNSQKEAAEAFRQHGRIIIEAPPGTGKTFLGVYLALCAYRLGWTSSESPALFLTFSRNARVQIEHELQRFRREGWLNAEEEKSVKVYNYHAFYFEMIQHKSGIWGCSEKLRPASILEHQTRLLNLLPQVQQNDKNAVNQASLVYALNRFQIGDLLSPDVQLQLDEDTVSQLNVGATNALREGRPQYDDFAPLFLNLLELCPELVEWLHIKYPVIILDEFQDTDVIQWEILQRICPTRVVILYDRYQMIYEWRGARPDRLEQVKNYLAITPPQEKQLTQIHRCGGQAELAQFIQQLRVDDLLGNAIDNTRNRPWLELNYISPIERRPVIPNENRCLSWLRFNGRIIDFHETTAILTRTNYLANYLFEHLRIRPDQTNRVQRFQGRHYLCRWIGSNDNPDEKIRDLIWQLRIAQSDNDLRGWLGNLLDIMLPAKISRELDIFFSNEFRGDKNRLFARKRREIFQSIRVTWLPIWDSITFNNFSALSLGLEQVLSTADTLVSESGYLDPDLVYYLKQLAQTVGKYQPGESKNKWQEFCDYLDNSHLRASFLKLRGSTSGLHILTIHQSKGREFDHVIIPWLSGAGEPNQTEDGRRFPIDLDYTELEDRKLLYVAVTRARRRVTIVYPQDDPSPFLRNWKLSI